MREGPYSDAEIARLRELWDEGHSTAEIGRRIGRSKNSIISKAHRIGVAARPSPIGGGTATNSRSMTTDDLAVAISLRKLGHSNRMIEAKLGHKYSTSQISDKLAAAGVKSLWVRQPWFRPSFGVRPASAPLPVASKPQIKAPAPKQSEPFRPAPRCSSGEGCRYISNDGPPWHFCCAEQRLGSPYCAEHHRICYVKVAA